MTKMTIEEATKLLKMSDQAIWLKGLEKEQNEAIEMAIKSLEADRKIGDTLFGIRNEITMLSFFNREEVVKIIDKHLKEIDNGIN